MAFTLAEVLITLAIIGIVAVLTIPTVVAKYQQKQYYAQFRKVYNTLANVMALAQVDNGDMTNWDWGSEGDEEKGEPATDGDNPAINYIAPYFKVAKTCEDYEDCFPSSYLFLNGEVEEDSYRSDYRSWNFFFDDGSTVYIEPDGSDYLIFFVDINGKKGPNIIGRDAFLLAYTNGVLVGYDGGDEPSCDPNNSNSTGETCSTRLLLEGKMDY